MRRLLLFIFALSLPLAAHGQSPNDDDIRALMAASKVKNNTYINSHAGFIVHLPEPPCQPDIKHSQPPNQNSAMLLQCFHIVPDHNQKYTFSIFVDYWPHNQNGRTIEQYAHSMRHQAETNPKNRAESDPDLKLIETETPRKWAGLDFQEMIFSHRLPDAVFYQGATCAFLKAYVLCFRAEAASVEQLRPMLMLDKKLEIIKPSKPAASPKAKK